jgi:hypothetical protein
VAAALYGNKNALAHFICGPLDDCSLEVQEYQDYNIETKVVLFYFKVSGTRAIHVSDVKLKVVVLFFVLF